MLNADNARGDAVKRESVNPWDWGLKFNSSRFFTTDVDGFLANYDVYAGWIEPAGVRPPQT